jgi:hypothetical protein
MKIGVMFMLQVYESMMRVQFIVVTYFQFDSNIHILYIFLGFLKNT